jgi:RNA polymerase sigma-70 factor (ECF subfamily)
MSPLSEDWACVDAFLKGDPEAFNRLFSKYKGLVLNLAFRFVARREAAEDVAQDVFLKIYEKKVKVDPSAKFTTWLYRVTVNTALDVVRKRKYLKFILDESREGEEGPGQTALEALSDPASVSPGQALADDELRALVREEIQCLPEKLKVPILLYQFQDTPQEEIAAILGISKKAVERRIAHAKEHLRKSLSERLK